MKWDGMGIGNIARCHHGFWRKMANKDVVYTRLCQDYVRMIRDGAICGTSKAHSGIVSVVSVSSGGSDVAAENDAPTCETSLGTVANSMNMLDYIAVKRVLLNNDTLEEDGNLEAYKRFKVFIPPHLANAYGKDFCYHTGRTTKSVYSSATSSFGSNWSQASLSVTAFMSLLFMILV